MAMAVGLQKVVMAAVAMAIISVSLGGKWVGAQVHHVVGGDRGWEPLSDVAAWSSGRTFRVGDKIWFAYSPAQEGIVELKSKEEYEACDISNPIRMYTDGIDGVALLEEGIRYFASSKTESCKNGLRVHVNVMPKEKSPDPKIAKTEVVALAEPPTTPSASAQIGGSLLLLLVGFWLCYVM